MVPEYQTNTEFKDVVDFHGCYCLDIAMGYRVAKALMREMGDELVNMKEVVALVGTSTCAIDAIQRLAGCTLGKRNLYLTETGKPVYILQNTQTKNAARVYVHFWDTFNHDALRQAKMKAKATTASASDKQALTALMDDNIDYILSAPEEKLFRMQTVVMDAPPKIGKFESQPCAKCGEYTKLELLESYGGEKVCKECVGR